MSNYGFGLSISRTLYPYEDNEPINLVSQIPTLYLFSTQPSLSEALAGTGAFQSKNYWTHSSTAPYPRTWSWDPVSDPDNTAGVGWVKLWEAVIFVKQNGQQHSLLREVTVERTQETDSYPSTTVQDLKDIYPAISNYADDTQLGEKLSSSLAEMKSDLKAKGLEWHKFHDLDELMLALSYKAIANVALSQISGPDDVHNFRYNEFNKKYDDEMEKLKLPYDSDNDGKPDVEKTPASNALMMLR